MTTGQGPCNAQATRWQLKHRKLELTLEDGTQLETEY